MKEIHDNLHLQKITAKCLFTTRFTIGRWRVWAGNPKIEWQIISKQYTRVWFFYHI